MENIRKKTLIIQSREGISEGKTVITYYKGNGKWTMMRHKAKRFNREPTFSWLSYCKHRIIEL